MIIGTWNVQGVGGKMTKITNEAGKLKLVNILVITKTKKKGQGTETWGQYIHNIVE